MIKSLLLLSNLQIGSKFKVKQVANAEDGLVLACEYFLNFEWMNEVL